MTFNNTTIANSIDVAANARASSIPFVDEFQPRDPTTSDIQYPIQKKWLNTTTGAFWELQNFLSFSGITTAHWVLIGNHSAVTETLTTDDNVVVPPTNNNINVFGDGVAITTTGNAATSTVTIHATGAVATRYDEDVGSAVPSGGVLNVLGSLGITTTGSGNTITIESDGTLATSYPCDSGTAIPAGGVLNVKGGNGETTVGAGNTITINYWSLTPYIVGPDANSQYTTIAAAIAQAIADGASLTNPKNIHIKPKNGGYTENITVVDGINLIGQGDQTLITGKISMSTAGEASVSNLILRTNNDFCISITGSSASELTLFNCNIEAMNHTAISQSSSNAASIIPITNCFFFINTTGITCWQSTSAGFISIFGCSSGNIGASTTQSSNSAGTVQIFECAFDFPISSTGTGMLSIINCLILTSLLNVTPLTYGGSVNNSLIHSFAAGGTASAVVINAGSTVIAQFLVASSSNTNVLTGAGTLVYAFISFPGGSSGHNVTTETATPTI